MNGSSKSGRTARLLASFLLACGAAVVGSPAAAMARLRSTGSWLCVALALAACGPIGTGDPRARPPAPVPGQDLTTWLEALGIDGGHEFYVRNDSDLIYRITRVMLTDCKNVRECGEHRVDVVLCPGETRRIFASRPFEPTHPLERESVYFNWDFAASSYEPDEPVVGADCGGTVIRGGLP